MDELELTSGPLSEGEIAHFLRAWFDGIIESLDPAALRLLREQCLRAERTPANEEIVATIDRRLAGQSSPASRKL